MSRPKRTYPSAPSWWLPDRKGFYRPPSERDWQKIVCRWAREFGWAVYHTKLSWGSQPGFPDLVLCRPPILMFVELKSDKGKVRAEQQEWIDRIQACGLPALIWRPADEKTVLEILA